MYISQRITGIIVLILLVLGSGVILSYFGKPYNTILFTFHKLIALVTAVTSTMLIVNLFRPGEVNVLFTALIIVAGFFVLLLFVTGALLSVGKFPHSTIVAVHAISTVFAATFVSLVIYLRIKLS